MIEFKSVVRYVAFAILGNLINYTKVFSDDLLPTLST